MSNLAIFGASGHGKVVADVALSSGWESITFFDDAWPETERNGHWEVAGNTTSLLSALDDYEACFIAIGDCRVRAEKQKQLMKQEAKIATLIHPATMISPYASMGTGTIIMPGVIINAYASIGDACIINTGAIIEHDCKIGDAVHIAPNATLSGNVTIGDTSWFGVSATARQGSKIGSNTTIGAGAVVIKNIPDNCTATGCPAKPA